ncbi:zinc-binding dehydrogenase [Sulfitobacter dubius]|uniref:zinc-binding dehydrogenase n=1 Tax=Sulfitobacter dubius TaxID=218673 RepID=UPI003B847C7A
MLLLRRSGVNATDPLKEAWPHLEAGRIAPVMDSVYPLEKAAEAHARMETSEHIGKIVLKVA